MLVFRTLWQQSDGWRAVLDGARIDATAARKDAEVARSDAAAARKDAEVSRAAESECRVRLQRLETDLASLHLEAAHREERLVVLEGIMDRRRLTD